MRQLLKTTSTLLAVWAIVLSASACEKNEIENYTDSSFTNNFIRSFEERTFSMSEEQVKKEIGKLNAIKKAYQLTEFTFTPLDVIDKNPGFGSYLPGVEYRGVPYSSVKEIGTFVGTSVSFYTFATAIRNPRSKLYTERVNESPYHGVNCRAYYGTVCSALVSYALGLTRPSFGSYDYVDSALMDEVNYNSPDDIEVADVLWKPTHVAIITDVRYSKNGAVDMIEVCEAIHEGCVRRQYQRDRFDRWITYNFDKVIRYSHIEDNNEYIPHPEIVPVAGESAMPVQFTSDICVNNGDRSNYLLGEDVTINIFSPYDSILVFKDDEIFKKYTSSEVTKDITMYSLPFGHYEARHYHNNTFAETSWIVVDYDVKYDKENQFIYFYSQNSTPVSLRLCNSVGSKGHSMNVLFSHVITEREVLEKEVVVPRNKMLDNYRYVQIRFMTEYGEISTWPIKTM